MEEILKLKGIIEDLQSCLKIKEKQIAALKKNPENMSKEDVEKFIKKHLPKLTENQINIMTKHKKRVNWTPDEIAEEIAKGFTMSYFSRQGHTFLLKVLEYPLPAVSTLNTWAMKMHIAPGILTDVVTLLKGYVETLSEGERQVILSYDEMACKALVKYSKGLDMVVGPHNEMQVVMVRGLISKFKQPVYIDFDKTMNKDNLIEVNI